MDVVKMERKMLFVDAEKCNGCRICELSCAFFHENVYDPYLSRVKVVKWELEGIDFPVMCRQCGVCEKVCPTHAITSDPWTRAINIDDSKCIGCKVCVTACPFGAMLFNAELNVAYTCDLCGGDPQCAKNCPEHAIVYMTPSEYAEMRRKEKAEKALPTKKRIPVIPQPTEE